MTATSTKTKKTTKSKGKKKTTPATSKKTPPAAPKKTNGNASTKTPKPKKKRISLLSEAATVLVESKEPMTCKQIVDVVLKKGVWKTNGKTPHSTLYAAIIREIAKKGSVSRFTKTGSGKFTVANTKKAA